MENIIYLIDRMRYDLEQISKTRDMQRVILWTTAP